MPIAIELAFKVSAGVPLPLNFLHRWGMGDGVLTAHIKLIPQARVQVAQIWVGDGVVDFSLLYQDQYEVLTVYWKFSLRPDGRPEDFRKEVPEIQ